jgi:tRNA(fMet)-specific endonuclease VapC
MLDTNMVSFLVRGHHKATQRLTALPMNSICISALTEAELLFGLAKRPAATRLAAIVQAFLVRTDVLPWDRICARHYSTLRARLEAQGLQLAPIDTLIASHALSAGAILVTNDRAFGHVADLVIEDWTE